MSQGQVGREKRKLTGPGELRSLALLSETHDLAECDGSCKTHLTLPPSNPRLMHVADL